LSRGKAFIVHRRAHEPGKNIAGTSTANNNSTTGQTSLSWPARATVLMSLRKSVFRNRYLCFNCAWTQSSAFCNW
jgi:hypothetical protein